MRKNRGIKRLSAIVLSSIMMFAAFQSTKEVVHAVTAENLIDIDKTATPLNDNDETTVNLSLSAPSVTLSNDFDVVFVVDSSAGSDYATYEAEAGKLLGKLASNQNINVKIGTVVFDGWGHDGYSLATGKGDGVSNESGLVPLNTTTIDNIKDAVVYNTRFTKYWVRHSNTEEPIRTANRWLEQDTSVPSMNKFIVTISDFLTFAYGGTTTYNNTNYAETPVSKNFGGDGVYLAQTPTDGRDLAALFSEYEAGTLKEDPNWNKDIFTIFNSKIGGFEYANFWNNFFTNIYQGTPNPGVITEAQYDVTYNTGNCSGKGVNSYEKSMCLTKDALDTSIGEGYTVFAWVDDENYSNTVNYNAILHNMPSDFAAYMAKIGVQTTLRSSGTSIDNFLQGLSDKIVGVFKKGVVTDVIGSKFELLTNKDNTVSPFTLTFDGAILTSVNTSNNEWSFGTKGTDGTYPYVVKYDQTSKAIQMSINTEMRDHKKLDLSYDLYLNDFAKDDALNTNESAEVKYTDFMNIDHTQVFPKPTVKFEKELTSAVNVTKKVSGADYPANQNYTFTLNSDAANPTNGVTGLNNSCVIPGTSLVNNEAELASAFGTGTFTKTGTYKFEIAEQQDKAAGYMFDQSSYLWTVKVESGTAHASASDPKIEHATHPLLMSTLEKVKDNSGSDITPVSASKAAFTNEYQKPIPTVPVKDVYKGTDTSSINGKEVQPEDELTYSITYTNSTGSDVTAEITDMIPAHTAYVAGSADHNGSYDDTGTSHQVKWVVAVADGKSVTVTFKVKVDADVNADVLSNTGNVLVDSQTYATNTVSNTTPKKAEPTPAPTPTPTPEPSYVNTGVNTDTTSFGLLLGALCAIAVITVIKRKYSR